MGISTYDCDRPGIRRVLPGSARVINASRSSTSIEAVRQREDRDATYRLAAFVESMPAGYYLVCWRTGPDVRETGSASAGAWNAGLGVEMS